MTRRLILTDWRGQDGALAGATILHDDGSGPHVVRDVTFGDLYLTVIDAWVRHALDEGRLVSDDRSTAEIVALADGLAVQHLVTGVEPVSHGARQIAQEVERRLARRGDAPLPSGGLFDDVARAQQDLFA